MRVDSTKRFGRAGPLRMRPGFDSKRRVGYGSCIGESSLLSTRPLSLRVLGVMPGVTPDAGAERSILTLAPALLQAGIELHLALLTDRQTLVPQLEDLGVVIHDLSEARRLPGRVRALQDTVEGVAPALVHATLFEASQVAQLASVTAFRPKRVPLLVTWASTVYAAGASHGVRWGGLKYGTLRWWEVTLARVSRARYHAVTQGVADYNSRRLRVDVERIRVGERGRDGQALRAEAERGGSNLTRQDLGVGSNGRLILTIGRQDHAKAHDSLVRTFDRCRRGRQGPGRRLVRPSVQSRLRFRIPASPLSRAGVRGPSGRQRPSLRFSCLHCPRPNACRCGGIAMRVPRRKATDRLNRAW